MGLVDGKIAFITGAGQGLGEGVAHALAADGAAVVLADRVFAKVEKVAGDITSAGYEALAIECDVRDRPSVDNAVDAAIARFGKLDILINNAMTHHLVPFDEATAEDLTDAYESSVLGTFNCMKACFPYL